MIGEHLSPSYLLLNPKHTIPMLRVCTMGGREREGEGDSSEGDKDFDPWSSSAQGGGEGGGGGGGGERHWCHHPRKSAEQVSFDTVLGLF